MATLTADKVASTVQPRTVHGATVTQVTSTFALSAALAAADVIELVKVPKGAVILDVVLGVDDLDSGATPAITLTVGDGDDTDRYIESSTVGQAGGVARLDNEVGVGHAYTAEDTIDVTVGTAPATGATTGDVRLVVTYALEA